jgi:hypothetical protein
MNHGISTLNHPESLPEKPPRSKLEASDVFAGVFHAMSARRTGADLEERTVCSGLKRKRNTLLPLLEHAIAHLIEFRVRFNVGVQFL